MNSVPVTKQHKYESPDRDKSMILWQFYVLYFFSISSWLLFANWSWYWNCNFIKEI